MPIFNYLQKIYREVNTLTKNRLEVYLKAVFIFLVVLPTRFELISMVPETIILSIELRKQCEANILKLI